MDVIVEKKKEVLRVFPEKKYPAERECHIIITGEGNIYIEPWTDFIKEVKVPREYKKENPYCG